MSREEGMGLSRDQIGAFLKYGLSRDDVFGLDQYQIQAFLALKNSGIKSDDLRKQSWLNSSHHLAALIYLIKIKKLPFMDDMLFFK